MTSDESRFHSIADATLMHFFDQLEDAFDNGAFEELELNGGVLTIETANKKSFIISKHSPSQQLWLASPISGGLHFSHHPTEATWVLPDGRDLKTILAEELAQAAQCKIIL